MTNVQAKSQISCIPSEYYFKTLVTLFYSVDSEGRTRLICHHDCVCANRLTVMCFMTVSTSVYLGKGKTRNLRIEGVFGVAVLASGSTVHTFYLTCSFTFQHHKSDVFYYYLLICNQPALE